MFVSKNIVAELIQKYLYISEVGMSDDENQPTNDPPEGTATTPAEQATTGNDLSNIL